MSFNSLARSRGSSLVRGDWFEGGTGATVDDGVDLLRARVGHSFNGLRIHLETLVADTAISGRWPIAGCG